MYVDLVNDSSTVLSNTLVQTIYLDNAIPVDDQTDIEMEYKKYDTIKDKIYIRSVEGISGDHLPNITTYWTTVSTSNFNEDAFDDHQEIGDRGTWFFTSDENYTYAQAPAGNAIFTLMITDSIDHNPVDVLVDQIEAGPSMKVHSSLNCPVETLSVFDAYRDSVSETIIDPDEYDGHSLEYDNTNKSEAAETIKELTGEEVTITTTQDGFGEYETIDDVQLYTSDSSLNPNIAVFESISVFENEYLSYLTQHENWKFDTVNYNNGRYTPLYTYIGAQSFEGYQELYYIVDGVIDVEPEVYKIQISGNVVVFIDDDFFYNHMLRSFK